MAAGRGLQSSRYASTASSAQQIGQPAIGWANTANDKIDAKHSSQEAGSPKSHPPNETFPTISSPSKGPPHVNLRTSSVNIPPAVNPSLSASRVGSAVVKDSLNAAMRSRKENELPIDMLAQTLRSTSLGSAVNGSAPANNNNKQLAKANSAASDPAVLSTTQVDDVSNTHASGHIDPPKIQAVPLMAQDLPNNLQDLEKGRMAAQSQISEYKTYFVSLHKRCDDLKQLNLKEIAKHQSDIETQNKQLNESGKRKSELDGFIATVKSDVCAAEKVIAHQQDIVKKAQDALAQYHDDSKKLTAALEASILRQSQLREHLDKARREKAEVEAKGLQLSTDEKDVAAILKQNLTIHENKLIELRKLEVENAANKAARLQEEKLKSEDQAAKLKLAAAQQLNQASIARNNDIEKREAEQGSMTMFHKSPAPAVVSNDYNDRNAPAVSTASNGQTARNDLLSEANSSGQNGNVIAPTPTPSTAATDDVDSAEELEEVTDEPSPIPPPARGVLLSNIPLDATIKNIFNIVFCGAVQNFKWGSQTVAAKSAHILFVEHKGCMDYLNAARSGIPWPTQVNCMINVALHEFPDIITEDSAALVQQGMTRSVRAGGSGTPPTGDDPSNSALTRLGTGVDRDGQLMQGLAQPRELVDLLRGRSRIYPTLLVWRFSNISDATSMLEWLKEHWQAFDIAYHSDPCEKPATGRVLGINGATRASSEN